MNKYSGIIRFIKFKVLSSIFISKKSLIFCKNENKTIKRFFYAGISYQLIVVLFSYCYNCYLYTIYIRIDANLPNCNLLNKIRCGNLKKLILIILF